jgi:2-octaprenyl-6-methoxyphenol hydroxylase
MQNFDIIIGGGGSIGLACALSLSVKNPDLSICVLDKNPQQEKMDVNFDGRNIALNTASIRLFNHLGIWENIKNKTQAINDIIISDGTLNKGASDSIIHFDAHDIQQESFGHFVLNTDIHHVFLEAIKHHKNIHLFYETSIKNIHNHTNFIEITDNHHQSYQGKLLIAADGKNSFIRNHFKIDVRYKDYGQTAIVLAVSHEKPHYGIAQEFFLPAGPFAILPLKGNQTSLVWVETHKTAQALLNAPDNVFFYELTRRFGDYLGILNIISKKFSYPLIKQIAYHLFAERTIFIGDAAHAIHPISGQGFNLGLRDIGFLCDIIHQHKYAGLDIGSTVVGMAYEKARKNDIHLLGNITNSLNGLFSNDCFIIQQSRRIGLDIVHSIPKLRNFFAKGASEGSIAQLPSLLKENF